MKRSKRTLTRLLDKEVSRVVRLRGSCARCNKCTMLQCAHIFSRRNMAVRFDLLNCIPLCYPCHMYWAHKEPIRFNDFVKEWLGEHKFNELKARANSVKKWTLDEMDDLLKTLKGV